MKGRIVALALVIAASAVIATSSASAQMFTFGCQRDIACVNQHYEAPCQFPLAMNPCQVDCRPPIPHKPLVPCGIVTACPSGSLPCHGVSYGVNPYPLFKVW
jgi:hypothetical protein